MISVFGTVFVDIKGYPSRNFNPLGRNIGNVHTVYGGVGHNVARNLRYLGHQVEFISSVDYSATGEDIIKKMSLSGIGTEYVSQCINGMGIWQAVFDSKGDIAASISQQPDFMALQDTIFNYGDKIIDSSDAVVLEIDLNPAIAREVCRLSLKYHKPLYMLVGNLSVVYECPELLKLSDCFVCNDIEARSLIKDFAGTDMDICLAIAEKYNLKRNVVSLGEKGSVFYDRFEEKNGHAGIFNVQVEDTAGAGDAFFSGIVHGLFNGYNLEISTMIGAKVASIVIACDESTTQDLYTVNRFIAATYCK